MKTTQTSTTLSISSSPGIAGIGCAFWIFFIAIPFTFAGFTMLSYNNKLTLKCQDNGLSSIPCVLLIEGLLTKKVIHIKLKGIEFEQSLKNGKPAKGRRIVFLTEAGKIPTSNFFYMDERQFQMFYEIDKFINHRNQKYFQVQQDDRRAYLSGFLCLFIGIPLLFFGILIIMLTIVNLFFFRYLWVFDRDREIFQSLEKYLWLNKIKLLDRCSLNIIRDVQVFEEGTKFYLSINDFSGKQRRFPIASSNKDRVKKLEEEIRIFLD
jgi:hypothetical protein